MQAEAIALVVAERERQDRLHGEHNSGVPTLDFEWIGIATEELGEASEALQYLKRAVAHKSLDKETADYYFNEYVKEVTQFTAVGVQLLERLLKDNG